MTSRALRIELRRSNARWMALLLLLTLVAVGEAERGLTVLALDWRQLLITTGALAMGVAAWYARRERRSRISELLATTARPRWQRTLTGAAALTIAVLSAYLVAVAAAAGFVVWAGGYLSVVTVPILAVGALWLVVGVSFGLVLGRWLPFVLVPPVLLGYLAVSLFLSDTEAYQGPEASGEPPGSLLLWGTLQQAEIESDFAAITAGTHAGQALWAIGLAAGALILFASTSLRVRATAVVPVVLGAAVAVPLLRERYADAYYVDPGATAPVCTPDAPRVCVLRAHENGLASLRGPAREALATLAAKLPDPPTSVVQVRSWFDSPPPPRADTIYIAVYLSGGEFQPVSGLLPDLRWELLLGAGTPGCANAPGPGTPARRQYDIARLVAAAWLLDREPPAPAVLDDPALLQLRETVPVYQALRQLPPEEQRSRVIALRESELACNGRDRLALLTGPE